MPSSERAIVSKLHIDIDSDGIVTIDGEALLLLAFPMDDKALAWVIQVVTKRALGQPTQGYREFHRLDGRRPVSSIQLP